MTNVHSKEQSARYDRTKRERCNAKLRAYKLEHGCVDCGYNERAEALQFDHVRGEKLFNLSLGHRKSKAKVEAEMQKCEVVCANCHAVRTADRRTRHDSNR